MRKLFTFLCAALMSVGMWADPIVAVPDPSSIYEPTQIVNGGFEINPNDNSAASGWKTTEEEPNDVGDYFEWLDNGQIPDWTCGLSVSGTHCVEMNAQNSAVLYQDLTTYGYDVIRWALKHAARKNFGPEEQSMRVEVGAPLRDDNIISPASGINENVDSKIIEGTKANYEYNGISGYNGTNGDNLEYLRLSKTQNCDQWYQVRGVYMVPEGQTTTRFAFIADSQIENPDGAPKRKVNKAKKDWEDEEEGGGEGEEECYDCDCDPQWCNSDEERCEAWGMDCPEDEDEPETSWGLLSGGNFLDDIEFSTLIGDLSATYGPNNSVVIKGYWGDTDTSKKLIIDINSTPNEVDMSNVIGQNFVITMTYDNKPTEVTIYHEDYVSAARTISVKNPISVSVEDVELEYDGNAHTISPVVTDPESGYTLKYGTSFRDISLDALTYTTAGTYTIYYSISAQDYTTYKGKATLRITNPASTDIPVPAAQPITINESSHGSVVASPTSVEAGETITLTATPDDGYQLKSISGVYVPVSETLNATSETVNGNKFQAQATSRNNNGWRVYNPGTANTLTVSSLNGTTLITKIEFTSTWGGQRKNNMLSVSAGTLSFDGNDPSTTVTINGINATSVTISGSGTNAGQTWCIKSVKVYYEGTEEEELEISDTENANVKTFTMVDGRVIISAEFEPVPTPTPTVVASGNCGAKVGDEYGTNLTWKYYSDNSLVIEGSGAMADFEFSYATFDMDYPWISYRNQITSVSVGEGITTIGNSAFSEFTNLQSISLPSTLQTIGSTVFYYCEKLPSITIPANVTSIGRSTFSYCELLASANIPVGVTLIPESLFYDCHALQTIVLPEGVQSIGEEAFYSCYGLTNISFPSTLTQIGDYAFNWSTSLASITLPASIESIAEAAFAACPSLTNVTMLGSTPATLGEDAFATMSSSLTFTVPTCELIDTYAAAGYDTYIDANEQSSSTSIVSATGDCGGSTPTAVEIGDPNNATEIETFLTNNNGQTIDELIIDRPVLNNMYNTLCLPLDMNATQIAASSLNGVEIREFTGASVEGTTLNLSVGDPVNAVVAGRPYIVKYSAASQLDELHFEGVTINNAVLDNMAVTFDGVTFKGTFTPFVMPNGLNFQGGYLFLGQNNQLYWPNTSNPLKPFRAYFYVDVESSTPSNAPKYRGMPARIVEGKNVATGVENAQSANQCTKVIVDGQLIIIKNDVRYNAQGQIVK